MGLGEMGRHLDFGPCCCCN